jgi:hypothetical protein
MRPRLAATGLLALMLCFGLAGQAFSAARGRVLSACNTDRAHFGPDDVAGSPRVACLNQHHVSLSLRCRKALAAAHAVRAKPVF